ncbi:MAG TPA: SDR family NAD(P)-dependent oxidoreductase [Thermodesulfobacteriota bacterium]
MRFEGRVIVVTGASREGQMGAVLAEAFGREGARLVVTARTAANVERVAERLARGGVDALAVAADLATEAGAAELARRTDARFGRVDVLVNLAGGLTRIGPAMDLTLADFERELASNLVTAFLATRAVVPLMRRGGGGRIVNFSSLAAADPGARMLAYNCAKAGVTALTRTLALELREHGIAVNAVAPGLIDTEANLAAMAPSDEERARRWVTRQEIAEAVLFLASDAASGVNGQVLAVTGRGFRGGA